MRLFATALLLTLSPLATLPAAAQVAAVIPDGTILDVSATGKTTRVPDIATIRAGVVTQSATAAQALADNAKRMTGVLAALKAAGVQPRDIATSNVSLQPQYRYENNQPPAITGYQASNTVSVRFRDIAKSGSILDALVAQGANQIDGPNLSLDQPDAALDEARVDAVKRARARAELYAKAAGLTVVRIVSISEGGEVAGPQPPVLYMARAKAQASADTTIAPGETDVTASVSVRFLLK
ncbi:SIMPL domain-containing protein [Sphingomonas panacisoli]|uniref:SIMPL domain-containing protein n=1 Tax=Sphingomonas panacisoli TaxID=1813879 RepID=A0A5B8LKG5_9SPHN|nr:SIMPL domain-containing protein [Sphingomonas panacisoli]QDZ08738.1 SIMPL domain-containing protein [Sphingomonas panacisoli]